MENWKWRMAVRLSCPAIWLCHHSTMPFTSSFGSWNPTRNPSTRKSFTAKPYPFFPSPILLYDGNEVTEINNLRHNRFDARGKPLSMGRRWSEVVSFGLRADFRFSLHGQIPSKGHLIINGTTLSDEGIYRCRVDFKNSPARHFRVQLNVTGEPHLKHSRLAN